MMQIYSLVILLAAYIFSTTNAASCTLGQDVNEAAMLDLHNQARELCGGSDKGVNPLEWDNELACASQAWANKCVWKHSHTNGVGENIASGYGGGYDIEQAIQSWYDEIWDYHGQGFTEATGHATQMVWKDTTKVGCGVARCGASQLGLSSGNEEAQYVVCQYTPPGNVVLNNNNGNELQSGEVFTPSSKTQITLSSSALKSNGGSSSTNTNGESGTNLSNTKDTHKTKKIITVSSGKAETTAKTYRGTSYADLMAWVKKQAKKGLKVTWKWHGTSHLKNTKRSMKDGAKLTEIKRANLESHNQKGVPLSHQSLILRNISRRKLHRRQRMGI